MSFNSDSFVSNDKREKERQDRLDRSNPPSTAHGQNDGGFDTINIDDLFGGSTSGNGGAVGGGGDSFNNFGSFGGSELGGGFSNGFNQQQMTPQKRPTEDVLFDVLKKGGGHSLNFSRAFVDSFKGLDTIFWSQYGAVLFKVSGLLALFLFLLVMLGVNMLGFMEGSGISTVLGVLVLAFNNDKARKLKQQNELGSNEEFFDINKINDEEQNTFEDSFGNSEVPSDNEEDSFFDEEDEFGADDDEFEFEEDEFYDDEPVGFETVEEPERNVNEVLSEVDSIPTGMHSRHFLYESYLKVLSKSTPEYSNVIVLTEEDEEWDDYSVLVREAQEQMGLDSNDDYDDDLSEILSVEKRLLTIKIEATRPKKLTNAKVNEFDNELTSLVSIEKGEVVEGRYTKTIVAGNKIYVTIYLGETATVSVKDAILKEKDFILDTSNKVPVVMGFDHMGKTVKVDLFDVESIITAGMPRGGKSMSVKTVISQIVQFGSPRDVVFYFGDVKGQLSDWYEFKMPHVKRFEGTPEGILAMLSHVTQIEGERRARIFREAGALNYKQYKKMHPESDMPIIYVVIDEMTTLSQLYTADDAKKYKSELINIVTRMPSFGVRLWGIPHVIKNEIIPKTVSDSIGCRMSVRGDESHIETTTGAKPKQFPYRLTNAGDCAVKMSLIKSDVFFMHSFILAKNDEGVSRILDYQTKLWNKLDPESAKTSYASKVSKRDSQNKVLDSIGFSDDIRFDENGMF